MIVLAAREVIAQKERTMLQQQQELQARKERALLQQQQNFSSYEDPILGIREDILLFEKMVESYKILS
jgi:hypothetical protein